MTTVALVPLRSLHDGKQRLRDVLSVADRGALVRRLFRCTEQALSASGQIARIGLVSPDPAVLAWAATLESATPLVPILQPDQGLNAGLEYGRQVLLQPTAGQPTPTALLVVLPDLPDITGADVRVLAQLSAPETVVIAPDRHEQGTNALLLRPADALPFRFGVGSLEQHMLAARERGLLVRQYRAPSIAFDIDTADDLALVDAPGAPLGLR